MNVCRGIARGANSARDNRREKATGSSKGLDRVTSQRILIKFLNGLSNSGLAFRRHNEDRAKAQPQEGKQCGIKMIGVIPIKGFALLVVLATAYQTTAQAAAAQYPNMAPIHPTIGSRSGVRSLMRLGLLDRLRLIILLIVANAGREPFREGYLLIHLDLIGTSTLASRLTLLEYQPCFTSPPA